MNLGLRTTSLSYARNNQVLFSRLELALNPGQALFIYGPNGSGKTSLLKVLAGLIVPTEGGIQWKGQSIGKALSCYHQELHFLGHQTGLKNNLSVMENLAYSQSLAGQSLDWNEREAALDKVQLLGREAVLARHLSAGQKRRLALARLLATPKPLWILDEPFTNLDQEGQQAFHALLEAHLQNQGMLILASHQVLSLANQSSMQKIYLTSDEGSV